MKKNSGKKKVVAKKSPKAKKASPAKKVVSVLRAFGKHVHPYGTMKHTDTAWQTEKLHERMKKWSASDQTLLQKAAAFATEKHEGYQRRSGTPFVIHPIRIANILISEWSVNDVSVVAAALLHDVVEDTPTTIKEVKDVFGNDVGKLVDGMTMWKGSETYETYVKRVARGPEALRLIKCADALDNLRSWHENEMDDSFPRWWRNTEEYILPMAVQTSRTAALAIQRVLADPWYVKKAGV